MAINAGSNAYYCGSSYGIYFGSGPDFNIADNSNSNFSSACNFPKCYENIGDNYTNLAGANNFSTQEIEVYLIKLI